MLSREEFITTLLDRHPHAPWSERALESTAVALGLDAVYHKVLFPGGVGDIYIYHENNLDTQMLEALLQLPKPQKIREKVAVALSIRVINLGNKAALVRPPLFLQASWNTADAIWRYAGDIATDFNHYTKRTLLSGVYLKARKKYLTDCSVDHLDTRETIRKSIEQVLSIAAIKGKLPKIEDIPILRLFS